MKKGILIFAFNNKNFDYLKMAAWSAKNIHRLLDLPVCVVTNTEEIPSKYDFDTVITTNPHSSNYRMFGDFGIEQKSDAWYNSNRVDAYAISPYDQTLVLDADYIVASDQLKTLFEFDYDFLCHRCAYDVTNRNPFTDHNYFGSHAMPMWWATVMMFRRSTTAELIFDSMNMIRDNWEHYRNIYGNHRSTYRNDHALTIALGMVNGHVLNHSAIPWKLATLLPGSKLNQVDQDQYQVEYRTADQQLRYLNINHQDLHVLGKFQLGAMIATS